MVNARRIGRLGTFAVGLGIGAAVASTPGIASADPVDPFAFDLNDISISFNGMNLLQEGTAVATSGQGDFAVAIGDGAHASATNGFGDYSLADGTNALANAGGSTSALGNFDNAIDIGNNDITTVGAPDGAFAGAGNLVAGGGAGAGSNDLAIDIGNNTGTTLANGELANGNDGAFAGGGGLIGLSGNGNNDTAIDFGNNSGENLGPAAVGGTFDTAIQNGNSLGEGGGAFAGFGNNDIATDTAGLGGAIQGGGGASADFGNNDFASAYGDLAHAHAGGVANFDDLAASILGNNDIANVFDPFGTLGSSAVAGASGTAPGDFDLASVFGDGFNADATGASFLTDILPSLFGETGSGAAVNLGSFLTDILGGFSF
jgi:hypothetical protein